MEVRDPSEGGQGKLLTTLNFEMADIGNGCGINASSALSFSCPAAGGKGYGLLAAAGGGVDRGKVGIFKVAKRVANASGGVDPPTAPTEFMT